MRVSSFKFRVSRLLLTGVFCLLPSAYCFAQGIVSIRSGGTVPANCTPKANNGVFYKNSGSNIGLYECTAANTWTFRGSLSFGGTLTPAALSGDVNDYNPTGLSTAFAVRQDGGASDRNITGLATGSDGRLLMIVNIGATNNLTLKYQSGSSSAANRFLFGSDLVLGINQAVVLRYDGTSSRWRPFLGGPFGTAAYQNTGTSGANLPFLNGTNTWSGTQTGGDAIFVLTTPKIVTGLKDTNGNTLVSIGATDTAVNYPKITNAATGNPAILSADGETNAALKLDTKGTGVITTGHALVLPINSLTDNGATIATDASLGNNFRVTALTASVTLSNPTNPTNGQVVTWEVIQNAAAAKTLAFGTTFAFGAELTGCTISATLSSHDFITAVYNSTTSKWYVRGCLTGY
jgi:hypothetical protein